MSISQFVASTIQLLGARSYESAMCLAMNAADATANREYAPLLTGPSNVKKRCEKFFKDNYDIITSVGTGGAVYSAPGSTFGFPDPEAGPSDFKPIESILYSAVRCNLTHEAEFPAGTFFNEDAVMGKVPSGYSIPVLLIYAVLLAVIGAKTNARETIGAELWIMVNSTKVFPDQCWGDGAKVRGLLGLR